MPKLYSAKKYEEGVAAARRTADGQLKELQAAMSEVKEENRRLAAENAALRSRSQAVSEALIAAEEECARMRGETEKFVSAQKETALRTAERARKLLDEIERAYPDRAATARFADFESRLAVLLGDEKNVKAVFGEKKEEAVLPIFSSRSDKTEEIALLDGEAEDGGRDETSVGASDEWDLKNVLETLGLSDD